MGSPPDSSAWTVRLSCAIDGLRTFVAAWVAGPARRLERAAALKDFLALLQVAPKQSIVNSLSPDICVGQLDKLSRDLRTLIADEAVPLLRSQTRSSATVVSPYAGGVTPEVIEQVLSGRGGTSVKSQACKIGVLNPGRTGFLSLSTKSLLNWRLEAVSAALIAREVDYCVLPGARFPPGSLLPDAFPYVWFGWQTTSWAGVGLFCRAELEWCIRPIEEFSEERIV